MKINTNANPPMGDGEWALRSLLKSLLIFLQHKRNALWSLYFGSKGLQLIEKIIFMQRGSPWAFLLLNFAKIHQIFLLFYCKPAKNSDEKNVKYTQSMLRECLLKVYKKDVKNSK